MQCLIEKIWYVYYPVAVLTIVHVFSHRATAKLCDICSLATRASHRPVFDHLQYAKTGRPAPFHHLNDISVYPGRQRGGGVPNEKNAKERT